MGFPKRCTVQRHKIVITPRYNETDQGGVIHNSVYPVWFEMGRTELLRANGVPYSELEKAGVFFVLAELHVKYRRPAMYDEPMELETVCTEVTSAKMVHNYRLVRLRDGILVAEGWTMAACVSREGKIRRMPEFIYPDEAEKTIV
jgi:acyl-CoA thioester hydrolase